MFALLLAAFLGVPPYPAPPKVLPPVPKVEAPKGKRLTCDDGSVIEWTGSAWRVVSMLQNVGASSQSPTNGCYISANGQKVCPAKR
jgi:hypothetical protein